MSETIIKLENISKQYRLGTVGTKTIRGDLQRWWYRMRGKEDPTLKIGASNKLDTIDGEYVWALRDINLEVKQGEVLGIIGKNGAGKSTLLKLLSRVTGPTTGSIKVKGRIASLLEVGTGFHPELTGKENIFLNGAILGMTKKEIRGKFDEIVDFAGVAKYIDTPVKRYSSGMYVRLAFAVAAHLEPDILVVDEVLAVGDAEFQKKAIGKMQDISTGAGRTVLFVSHNMASVKNLCNKGCILQNGKTIFEGDINLAIDNYISNFQKAFNQEIAERIDRKGNQIAKFLDIKIKKSTLEEIDTVISNDDVLIELIIKSKINTNNCIIVFSIDDNYGNRLTVAGNEYINKTIELFEGTNKIRFFIKEFPFNEGSYGISLFASINNDIADWLIDAKKINVVSGDFYGTGKLHSNSHGKFLIKYEII